MPTPVGHTLGGLILLVWRGGAWKRSWLLVATVFFFTLAPDVDFLFGLLAGDANLYHHQATHSLLFVVVAGALGGLIWGAFRPEDRSRTVWLFTAAGLSHLALDLLCFDTSAPYGMPIFWPFSGHYLISPVTIFSDIHRSSAAGDFFYSLWNLHNWRTVRIEAAILAPVLLMMYWLKKRGK